MQASDLDAVFAIEAAVHPFPWSKGNFRDSLHAGYSCWVYEQQGRIFGYVVQMLVLDEAHILNLCIAREEQGKGHGWALLTFAMDKAREYGALNMFLEVRVSNTVAIKLYEKAGFSEMAVRHNYYPAAVNRREDALLMGMML